MNQSFDLTVEVGRTKRKLHGYPNGCRVKIRVSLERVDRASLLYWNLNPINRFYRFSMSGEVWKVNQSDIYSGGQICDEIAQMFPDNQPLQRLVEIWREWHLNDLQACTESQEKSIGLYEVSCSGVKYRYGSTWLCKTLAPELIQEIKQLCEKLTIKEK